MNEYNEIYKGTGYHVDMFDPESLSHDKKIDDDNINLMRLDPIVSTQVYDDPQINEVLTQFEKYNRVKILSWDLASAMGSGTIVRIEQHIRNQRLLRSPDFNFKLTQYNHSNTFRYNMNRLKEEVDANIVLMGMHQVQRWSGSTESGSIQLFIVKTGSYTCGWLSIVDQMFIPITNKWYTQTLGQYPYIEMEQQLDPVYTLQQAISRERPQK